MEKFAVKQIEWEYGEQFGHVFHPKNLPELQEKVKELDAWGRKINYPFLINIRFVDNNFHLAFTVGHSYSFMEFAYKIVENLSQLEGPFYLVNGDGDVNEIIPVYYMASYTEPDTTKMLPMEKVLDAIYYFVLHKQFPSFIKFNAEEVNRRFVTHPPRKFL